jgi:hypothetical protein
VKIAKCMECGNEYQLEANENLSNFQCECGGKLKNLETHESSDKNIEETSATTLCPHCGTYNPEDVKLCKVCKRLLTEIEWNKSSKSNNKQKSTGNFETWNQQSNGVKVLTIITVCCIGLTLIFVVNAMFSPDQNTQLSTQATSWSNTLSYKLNSAVNNMISYYDASFKNFFQNLIKTGSNAAGG